MAPGNSATRRLDDRCENRSEGMMMGKQVAQGAVDKRSSDWLVHTREKLELLDQYSCERLRHV